MKALKKKREREDMLITHKPKTAQDRDKTGREGISREAESVKGLRKLKQRLASTSDPHEREKIMETIQTRFGNETAERIVRELKLLEEDEGSSQSGTASPPSEKTKG